jgi:hypothetical protein
VADYRKLTGLLSHIGFVEVPSPGERADSKLPGFQDNNPVV